MPGFLVFTAGNAGFWVVIYAACGQGMCRANVAELVDALDLGSSGVTRESSSLSFRTNLLFDHFYPAVVILLNF